MKETISIDDYVIAAQQTKEKKYWLNKLSGELVKSNFYYDSIPKNVDVKSSGKEEFRFTGDLFSKFLQLSNNSDLRLHMILTAGLVMLIEKYTGERDIIIGTPIYKQDVEGKFVNTVLVLRDIIETSMTFKEILVQVRQTILEAVEHINYPVELLAEQVGMSVSNQMDFPLFDIVILLENIHDKKYVEHLNYNITFSLARKENTLEGIVEYNTNRYHQGTIKKIINHYTAIFQQVLFDVNLKVSQVDIVSEAEKRKLLNEFNDTEMTFPRDKTIHQLFEEQVERTPGNTAVSSPIELRDVYIATSCFKKNPYIFESSQGVFKIFKTHTHHSVVINQNMLKLINSFTGEYNLESIFSSIKNLKKTDFVIFTVPIKDMLGITHDFNQQVVVFSDPDYQAFISLVKLLHKNNLIEFHGLGVQTQVPGCNFDISAEPFDKQIILKDLLSDAHIEKADVLLLGDTPGMPTTGLLYMASFLVRNGVKALCRFYDDAENYQATKAGIEKLLGQIQPKIVGISLKWFLYIARVMDMAQIIKDYAHRHGLDIKIVVGGNTASYYWQEIIKHDCIDYIIRGDGEEPLLKICRGEKDIPNCVYKQDGKIIENPITYIQDEKNAAEIYLSNLDEIILDKFALRFGSFFVYTQKGCAMNCLYCGGCNKAQQIVFNRKHVLRRGITETRKDILEAKKHISTFYFEFDIVDKNIAGYFREIWQGIDLSGHFCLFNTLTPPSQELVELVSKTFKYVYWDFDICTPSERHRKQLESLGLVKPQPSDAEIMDFLTKCEKYKNIEVRPNLITGLPYFTIDDIEPGEKLLTEIMNTFSCFSELHWARLHAQPGAPILESAEQLQMHAFATSFADFLEYSRKNAYANVETFNYPFIYYKDEHLNSRITNFYAEINKKLSHYTQYAHEKINIETLTYRELNERAGRLAAALIAWGVKPGDIVGLMLERSVAIPVAILGVLKCGAAYLPIDPEFPPGRVEYMLKDSSAKILIKKSEIDDLFKETFHYSSFTFDPSSLAYIIYTSGTTGKPKGVAIKHENLVNYVNWFSGKVGLSAQDKTLLATSFAFDLGYTSLYNSLLNGCTLHILPREIYLLAERLFNYIKQNEITFIKMTPSLFSVMVNSPAFSQITCQSLRLAAMGGEPINVKDIEKAHSICPHLSIMNHYGPTETTIGCAANMIDFSDFEEYKKHPVIGKPIANAAIYILSKDLDLLPVGVPGELCISGAGVGLGYLNQPELTAEKFRPLITLMAQMAEMKNKINKSFAGGQGAVFQKSPLVYRTGDLARWLSDGTIEFLGRIDTQVKIRGYRIELGEIENCILKYSAVKEVVVVVKDQKEIDSKYICAYIVPAAHGTITEVPEKTLKRIPGTDLIQLMGHIKAKYNEIAVKSNGKSLTFESLDQISDWAADEITAKYDDRYKLSRIERTRYKRQMLLHGWGIEAQEKLKSSTVFVAGAGGGASPTIFQLALAGVGTIKVCDFDEVELSNLNRQFLHDEERLGMNKALSAQMTVKKINPHVKVIPYTGKLTRENVGEWVGDADIIFDMFDGPADKFILSEFAVVKKIPHIIISMTDINAYTAVCHTPYTPCYHCLFDKKKLETIVSGMVNQVENYSKNPLPVVATSLFISTGIAVNEGLKILLGFKKPAYNKFFYFNQRGEEEDLVYTTGYKAMTYLFSDYFLQECKEQGFDWDTGWRGNFLEELITKPDPHCPLCSNEGEELRKDIEKKIKNAAVTVDIKEIGEDAKKEEDQSLNTVGVLLDHDIDMVTAIMGVLKAGKSIVPIDPTAPAKTQLHVLEDSEVRVILTNDQYIEAAEKLIDKYNHNIKIVNISLFNKSNLKPGTIETNPAKIAYLLYPPDPNGTPGFNSIFTDIYNALSAARTYIFNPADQKQSPGRRGAGWPNELRDYLLTELPDYMVPSYFVQLDKIPLTPNGKIDKKALPEPGLKETNDYIAPGNELEEKIAGIWAEVLGVKKDIIGIDTNFFALGGHSLNATVLIARIHKELNVKFPLAEFFKIPTIKGLSGYILAAEKETFASIEPVEKKEYYKLSSAQKRLYALQQMEENNIAYNMSQVFPLGNNVDKEKLMAVFNRLLVRHETLRTSFEMVEGEPIQKIHENVDWELQLYKIDNTGWDNVEQHFKRPFYLNEAPLLRVGLVEIISPFSYYYLRVEMHHIISDEVSQNILQEEFMELYQGRELPSLRLKYKDYSEWQYSKQQRLIIKEQEKFWLEMFADEVPVLNLLTDFPRPIMQSFEGSTVEFLLTVKEGHILKELVNQTGVTIYMCILSVCTILLSRLSGQEDVVIGTPIAARRHADLEKIIGMFVNTLVMRNNPCGEKSYREFLLELKERTLKAYENQEYPFDELAEKILAQRDTSRNPVFDVMFDLVRPEENNPAISIIEEEDQYLYIHKKGISKFDLTFTAVEQGDRFLFNIEYCTRLFKSETINRFISHFKRILEFLSEDFDQKLSKLEIISVEEKQRILYEFNDTMIDYPRNKSIPQLFEEITTRMPDNIAVIGPTLKTLCSTAFEANQTPLHISYGELNKQSVRLAGLLIGKGVLPEIIVGIMIERSVEMIIGIMGILKAGGAYLPIDPEYPGERINYMLKDSGTKLLVTTNDKEGEKLRSWEGEKLLLECIIYDSNHLNGCPRGHQHSAISIQHSNHLCYIIYTSGSTGKSKGVMVQHNHLVHAAFAWRKEYKLLEIEVILLQMANFCFDVFAGDLARVLINGGKMIINPEKGASPHTIYRLISNHGVTLFESTPPYIIPFMNYIYENKLERGLASLQLLILGSDSCATRDFKELLSRFGTRMRIVNSYGVTEATIDSSYYEVASEEVIPAVDTVPIGRPLPNVKFYILDRAGMLLPLGVPGELCIGGAGVTRGYLNKPELSASKFGPQITLITQMSQMKYKNNDLRANFHHSAFDPHIQHSILYRTGDLARWLPCGNVEFLGRMDYQVKIRGFRIELGEIENQLLQHWDIKEAVVMCRGEMENDKYICAYIVTRKETSVSGLREYLVRYLPAYMTPSYFVNLEKIPLNANGKIDHKALPDPKKNSLEDDMECFLPQNEVEKILVDIWAKILGREKVGINQNFFAIGGDSIKSIQIISRMSRAGYKMEMKDLFQYPVISKLAPHIKKLKRIPDQSVITGKIPLTPIQKAFFNESHPCPHHYNQAVMLYSSEGFDKNALKNVFTNIQEHHDVLRMTYNNGAESGGEAIQFNHGSGYPLYLEEHDLRNCENCRRELKRKADAIQESIDLEKGPLMKLGLFHLDDGDRLLIAAHHLIIDGVSWRILFEDIETLYSQYKRGEKLVLPHKTDSFKLWSEKLSAYANSKILLKEKKYWQKIESIEVSLIPKDFAVDDNYIKDLGSVSFTLTEQETEILLTKVNEPFNTEINDIFLMALGMGIKKTFEQERVLIALEGHGREEILEDLDISRTVGWFTNVYPVVLDISYADHPGCQIKEIKETLRRIPNKGIGYGILRYLTHIENKKEITFKLKPQICFNYLGQFDADIKQKSSFELAKESAGNSLGLNNRQEYLLDVSGIIANNRLTMTIVYNKTHFKPETMSKLIGSFESELSNINAFCSTRKSVEKTPSDFTYKELSIDLLQQLLDVYPNVEDIYTLSPMQEGMLFHALMDQSSNSYFEQTAFRLHSELDIFLVEKSFNEVVNRHDILRTAFIHKDTPRAVQVVLKSRALDFYYQDISQIGGQGEKEFFLTGYKEKDKQRSFDLSKDVLMRIAVFRLSPVEYQFIWSHHHILMDGWCIGILNTEFFEIYISYLENRPHRLKEVKPYRNYIKWLEKQDKEESVRYWENYLDSYEEQAGIPRTKTRKITKEEDQTGYRNETVSIVSNMEKTAGLNKLAAVNNVTLNIVTQTLWGILLGKYNGKEDVLFGGVVSGRPPGLEGIESMLGLFINTIPVRIRFESGMKLNTLLREIQEEALASEPHHYHPLAEIQSRSILRQNLIDHLFIFENYPIKEQLEISESGKKQNRSLSFKLTDVSVFEQTNYDFNVVLGGSDQLKISFQYNGNVYDEYSVERIAKYFSLLIDQVIGNQELEIRELTFLSEEEKEWVLYEFNNTAADYPKDKTIHQLFVEQAAKTPNHIALVGVTAVETTGYQYQITYRQLNNLSDYLAGILSEKGVLPDNIVGIIIERSVDMIIGILGILKSGGAYMPIDPEYPQERIEYMLKDSGTKLLAVANDQESEKVRRWEGEKVLLESIIYDSNHLNGCPCQGLQNPALSIQHSNHLCYIIYTSGSTGNPKGVIIEHHSLVNRLNWMQKAYPIDERDTILQKTTFTFDVSVWEIFWWSMVGARLFLLSPGGEKDPGLITQTIERNNITTMHFVPSMLSAFLDYLQQAGERGQAKKLATLKQVIASGEALLPTQVELFIYLSTKTNGTLLANLYGPTEATIDVSYFNCLPGEREIIPIGKPIDNINLYILDRSFHLQPIGIPGELCIGGVGLARGYLNRSDLTAEKFRPLMPQIKSKNSALQADFHHSASDIPRIQHSILYCTGDLARWLPDGNMEFLGRIDQQVKIRGFRVELGEIENRLLKVSEIKEAVVVAQETGRDDKYLCAYFVSDRAYEISELHEILAKELPDYMLPSYFVRVENIPLTANGKVDRRALPLPEAGGMGNMGSEYIPPANEIEEKLTHIWSELLGIEKEKICTLHNFFEIGGTSLNLIRQISLIYKEFGYEISVNLIYRNPTIREIAKCIQSKKYVEEPVVLLNQPGQKRLFFFPPGVGFGVSYQALANILNDYSIYSFNFIENENRLHEYVEIITTIQKTGPHILVGYSAAGKLIFKVVEAMETRGFEVSDIILCDCFWDKNVIKEGSDEAKVLEDGLNRFIIEIEKYMDHSGIGYLKEKVRKRAKMYLEYLQNLNKFEGIHSNVHLIISEQMWDDETSDRNCWDELTDKPVMIYNGFGSHIRMFSEEPLEKNAELIKKILDRIESERQMLMRADI